MFETKKQLKEEIKRLKRNINILEMEKDIAVNQVKIAEGETRNAKTVTNYWKTRFENVEKIIKENEELNKENAKLKIQTNIKDNYIKRLEKEVLIQKQTIKDKDEYISILHDSSTLYATIKTKLQNSQLKDKLDRISAILNED